MADDIPDEPGIRDFKARISDYINRVIYRGDDVWVTKNGKRVAVLVTPEFYERAKEALAARGESGAGS